jgi:hypothetical protein
VNRAEVTAKVDDTKCAGLLGGGNRIEVVVAERNNLRKLILGGGQYSWAPSTGELGINVPWVYRQEKEWKIASLRVQQGNCTTSGTLIGFVVGASLGAITGLGLQVPAAGFILAGIGVFAGGLAGASIGSTLPNWHRCQ